MKFNLMTNIGGRISGPAYTIDASKHRVDNVLYDHGMEVRFSLGNCVFLTVFKAGDVLPEWQGRIDVPNHKSIWFAVDLEDVSVDIGRFGHTAQFKPRNTSTSVQS